MCCQSRGGGSGTFFEVSASISASTVRTVGSTSGINFLIRSVMDCNLAYTANTSRRESEYARSASFARLSALIALFLNSQLRAIAFASQYDSDKDFRDILLP